MTTPVLVTGGTGTLGRLVVARLRVAGRPVRVLSRQDHDDRDGIAYVTGDLRKDVHIDSAVAGIETIVHCAGGPRGDDVATANLVRAATRGGVTHVVYISIVNAERLPIGYYRRKVLAEQVIADSGLGSTTLRAAQFHDLVLALARTMSKLPVLPVPSAIRLQPIEADEVAARLVELSMGDPGGPVGDLVGPKVYPLLDLVRGYLTASGTRRPTVSIPLPGRIGRAYRNGDNLCVDAAVGQRTWEQFLAGRVGAGPSPSPRRDPPAGAARAAGDQPARRGHRQHDPGWAGRSDRRAAPHDADADAADATATNAPAPDARRRAPIAQQQGEV